MRFHVQRRTGSDTLNAVLTSHRHSRKRPDARRLPDDTRRAPQPNRELQAFGTAESEMNKSSWQKTRRREPARDHGFRGHSSAGKPH
jgi:hypothetical protein